MTAWKDSDSAKTWRRIVSNVRKFPMQAYYDEVEKMHVARSSRSMRGSTFSVETCINVTTEDVGYRSRIVEISFQARRALADLIAANEAARSLILTKHHESIGGGTITERKQRVDYMLRNGVTLESKLSDFIDNIDVVINDIDQTAWALKRALEALELRSRREYIA